MAKSLSSKVKRDSSDIIYGNDLQGERTGFFEKLLSATQTVGQLEMKLLHLDAPKSED